MPYRRTPIVTGEIYHVFNRSIAREPIFLIDSNYRRAMEAIDFYRYQKLPLRFSHYRQLSFDLRQQFIENLKKTTPGIEILAFCIMPNHIHFLLKQTQEKAIADFMRNFQHSYSMYFNTKYKRNGSLYQSMFQAVRIETDEQLLHVSRYIHLNPVTAYIIEITMLENYLWSSFRDYILEIDDSFVQTNQILSYFKSKEDYKKFVFDQADYQRKLGKIKHLKLE